MLCCYTSTAPHCRCILLKVKQFEVWRWMTHFERFGGDGATVFWRWRGRFFDDCVWTLFDDNAEAVRQRFRSPPVTERTLSGKQHSRIYWFSYFCFLMHEPVRPFCWFNRLTAGLHRLLPVQLHEWSKVQPWCPSGSRSNWFRSDQSNF